jgi:hypothetical protein
MNPLQYDHRPYGVGIGGGADMMSSLEDLLTNNETVKLVRCIFQSSYMFAIVMVFLTLAWIRALPILNRVFRIHVMMLGPVLQDDKVEVRLSRRASRIIMFAAMMLTLAATCFYFTLQLVMLYAVAQAFELIADAMPTMLMMFSSLIRQFFGTKVLFGGLHPQHLPLHGAVLGALVLLCMMYTMISLDEKDLVNASMLRDKMMRLVYAVPLVTAVLYIAYTIAWISKTCF